jgi:rubredoxin
MAQFNHVALRHFPTGRTVLEMKMKKYQCIVCGWIYDEAEGWPQDGIAPGTKWDDIPDDWTCPDCGVSKMDFEMIEI